MGNKLKKTLYSIINCISKPICLNVPLFGVLFVLLVIPDLYYAIINRAEVVLLVASMIGTLICNILLIPLLLKQKKCVIIYKSLLLIFAGILFIINCFCLYTYDVTLQYDIMMAAMATNFEEVKEYIDTYMGMEVLFYLIAVVLIIFVIYKILCRYFIQIKSVILKSFICIIVILGLIIMMRLPIISQDSISILRLDYILDLKTSPDLSLYKKNPKIICDSKQPSMIVMIIGESFSKSHSSLYGYSKMTNPKLQELSKSENLKIFENVVSPDIQTLQVFRRLMTSYSGKGENWYEYQTLIELMQKAGYYVSWISNQSKKGVWDNEIWSYAQLCDTSFYTDERVGANRLLYDESVIMPIKKLLNDEKQKSFYIVNLIGSHSAFKCRYPETFNLFKGEDYEKDFSRLSISNRQLLAEYDNSILYNDNVVWQIFNLFREKEAIVFYFSDHGIDVFNTSNNYIGHATRNNKKAETIAKNIPFMVYTTEKYRENFSSKENTIKESVQKRYSTDSIMYTIIDIAGVDYINKISYKEKSLFNN